MDKVTERIIERIPDGMALQLQTYSNEILDLSEDITKLEIINHNLQQDLKDKEKTELKYQREIIALNKEVNRLQIDFNRAEQNYLKSSKRLEDALKIKSSI